jgi:hypothetical protein
MKKLLSPTAVASCVALIALLAGCGKTPDPATVITVEPKAVKTAPPAPEQPRVIRPTAEPTVFTYPGMAEAQVPSVELESASPAASEPGSAAPGAEAPGEQAPR